MDNWTGEVSRGCVTLFTPNGQMDMTQGYGTPKKSNASPRKLGIDIGNKAMRRIIETRNDKKW